MSNPDLRSFVPDGCRFGAHYFVEDGVPIDWQLNRAAQRLGEYIARHKQIMKTEIADSRYGRQAITADFYVFTKEELYSMIRRAYEAGVEGREAMNG